jgi:hypothetical protein
LPASRAIVPGAGATTETVAELFDRREALELRDRELRELGEPAAVKKRRRDRSQRSASMRPARCRSSPWSWRSRGGSDRCKANL